MNLWTAADPGELVPAVGTLLKELAQRPLWMRDASCADYPMEWWFPEPGQQQDRANAICAGCRVRVECLS